MNTKELNELGLIAGLMSLGYSPLERRTEGRRVMFKFEWDDNMEELEKNYFNNRLDVDARTYSTQLKALKSSIYQLQEQIDREVPYK